MFERDSDKSFFKGIFYSIYYTLLDDKNEFEFIQDSDKFLEIFGEIFLGKLQLLKPELNLNLCLSTFESQCHIINDLLMENNLFLRVYEHRILINICVQECFNSLSDNLVSMNKKKISNLLISFTNRLQISNRK